MDRLKKRMIASVALAASMAGLLATAPTAAAAAAPHSMDRMVGWTGSPPRLPLSATGTAGLITPPPALVT